MSVAVVLDCRRNALTIFKARLSPYAIVDHKGMAGPNLLGKDEA